MLTSHHSPGKSGAAIHPSTGWLLASIALALVAVPVDAQSAPSKPRLDIYGAVVLDLGYQAHQNDPNWFDVLRPSTLPSFKNQFGKDGRTFAGVRPSRFGFKSFLPTGLGEVKTIFEFDLFGTGPDAGQTTFRLRHAYGELGKFGAGQTWSPFMDADVLPKSLEFRGPNGMVSFRNVQFRFMPIRGESFLTFALERPGATGDAGNFAGRIELSGIQARFPLPDLSAEYRMGRRWGYIELAGIVRRIQWDDNLNDAFQLSGSATGWGFDLSSSIRIRKDVLRLQAVYGEGIENYMNDAPVDIGIENNFSNPVTPGLGKALPVLGLVGFYERTWSEKWASTLGYSRLDIDNSDGQTPDAFHRGQYALVNLLHYPVPGVMVGVELQWDRRDNHSDGFSSEDVRVQFSAKYDFKHSIGGD